jgi:hypothetical protein
MTTEERLATAILRLETPAAREMAQRIYNAFGRGMSVNWGEDEVEFVGESVVITITDGRKSF